MTDKMSGLSSTTRTRAALRRGDSSRNRSCDEDMVETVALRLNGDSLKDRNLLTLLLYGKKAAEVFSGPARARATGPSGDIRQRGGSNAAPCAVIG
jgi:hypothetical protein